MKKLFALLLSFALIFCSLSALTSCGAKGFDETKSICVVTREDGSGTKSAFMELIGLKGKTDVSGVIVSNGTASVMQEIQGNTLAIAYDSLGFVVKYDVKILKVDGVYPTIEAIKSGEYKISRPLSVVYQEDNVLSSQVGSAFLEFLQSTEAQELITEAGYVSTVESSQAYVVKPGLSGTVTITGSTSLKPLMEEYLAPKFESLQSGVKVTVGGGGSGTGYNDAQNGVSTFGMISEEFTASKAESCTYYQVAKDGIAVIVNNQNPFDNISLADLKNIYDVDAESSAIKIWADVTKES